MRRGPLARLYVDNVDIHAECERLQALNQEHNDVEGTRITDLNLSGK